MSCQTWPSHPTVLEIDTWVWLADLSAKYGWFIELDSVPAAEWEAFAELGFDAVWLKGVWERSPAGIKIANLNEDLLEAFRRVLPDFHPLDNVGAADCVRRYRVDEMVGGPVGLAIAREELVNRGMRLILDFVPNYLAPDHAWVIDHPEYLIQGSSRGPGVSGRPDVVQLNVFHPGVRQAASEIIAGIAQQCDGVVCDNATLVLNAMFERTWLGLAGQRPGAEYWTDVLAPIQEKHPGFLFIAEAHGKQGRKLQELGFDFCSDNTLNDRLEDSDGTVLQVHLRADPEYQGKLIRGAATLSPAKERAAAVTMATLPGARLFHDAQLQGRRIQLPGFLGRRGSEPPNKGLQTFYKRLLKVIDSPLFHDGQWRLCSLTGRGNRSLTNVLAWTWVNEDDRCLVVVNLGDRAAKARVHVPWPEIPGVTVRLEDALSEAAYDADGDEIRRLGVFVELAPWSHHIFRSHAKRQQEISNAA
jgi:hypothetical protein